jgi:hypothetical protein
VTEEDGSRSLSFSQKSAVALALFGAVALLAWRTMEPGKFRDLVFVVVGGLALRVLLGWRRSERDRGDDTEAR